MKLSSLEDPSLIFVTLHLFPGVHVDEMIFKEKRQFCTFYPKIISFEIHVTLPYRCYMPNLVYINSVVLKMKYLTHDGRQPKQ